MKSLLILNIFALIGFTLSKNCATCSKNRKKKPKQDCIVFANEQDQEFYQGEFLEYSYEPCNDPEEIISSVNPDITCIPLKGSTPLLKNQTCEAGQYKHYHWTIQDYDVINDNMGSSIEFALTPCHGHPEIYIKPQILYAGIPMCQLFETIPGTHGEKTSTWPFPDNRTGTGEQGPDKELFELERQAKKGATVHYPGSFFSKQTWGHNGSITSADGRPQPHRIRIPSISYGGFFVSVYCSTASVFEVGIVAQQKKNADRDRYLNKDEDSLAMKIRRFGWEIDDKKLDKNWVDLTSEKAKADDFLQQKGYSCDPLSTDYQSCTANHYIEKFGLAPFSKDVKVGAHHPEIEARSLQDVAGNASFCFSFDKAQCALQCCKWSEEGDSDIADFLKYGPFQLRKDIETNKGICRPATTKQSLCVTKKLQKHMSTDNRACKDDDERDEGDCERAIQATMEVTFYTGEAGGGADESRDTWPLFQLNHVEMNNCVKQKDKVGHKYCWEADFTRYVKEYGSETAYPAGKDGYKWKRTCGVGSGTKERPACDPQYQARGKCFWDGTPDSSIANQSTRETQWSKNADDCVMWTPCGVMKNGMPVMIEHKKGKKSQEHLIQRLIPGENNDQTSFDVKGSIYLYGHVDDITRESVHSTSAEVDYNRYVLTGDDTWLNLPARTWVRVEVPVFNDVTYFFNVLRKLPHNNTVESYTGVSAVTTFYHKTQLYSDTTIIIIAGVVVVALLFLLIPFIFTKHKIKEHLRKVYEKHKERGQGRPKEGEGEAGKGDNVVNYAADDKVVGYAVQDIAAAEKEDPAMLKKDSSEPRKDGNTSM